MSDTSTSSDDAAGHTVFRLALGDARSAVGGELAARTRDVLAAAIAATRGSEIVIHMTEVDFVDSTGLRTLSSEHLRLTEHGGLLRVVASPAVARTIELAGLSDVLSVTTP